MLALLGPLASSTDAAENRRAVRGVLSRAGREGARLVVLPEYASVFDPRGVDPTLAEPLDGPFVTVLREESERHGLAVVAGCLVPGERPGLAVNVAVAVDHGRVAGTYRKVHLYDAFGHRESDRLEPGPAHLAPLVVDVEGVRVGVVTCYDLRFPESVRRVVDAGATAVAVPAAWAAGPHKADQWSILLRARAVESCAYVLGVAQHGRGVTGSTVLVDPRGVVRAEAEALRPALGEVDPALVEEVRAQNPSLENRRYRVVPLDSP